MKKNNRNRLVAVLTMDWILTGIKKATALEAKNTRNQSFQLGALDMEQRYGLRRMWAEGPENEKCNAKGNECGDKNAAKEAALC